MEASQVTCHTQVCFSLIIWVIVWVPLLAFSKRHLGRKVSNLSTYEGCLLSKASVCPPHSSCFSFVSGMFQCSLDISIVPEHYAMGKKIEARIEIRACERVNKDTTYVEEKIFQRSINILLGLNIKVQLEVHIKG